MEEASIFDKLVADLSSEERRELLHRIENSVSMSDEPLKTDTADEETGDSQAAYQALNPFLRFLYLLKGLFFGKKSQESFEDSLLARLKRHIMHQVPKLVDFRHSLFLDRMKTELEQLRDSSLFFSDCVGRLFEKDRGEFIAFLFRCHVEALATRIEYETDPKNIIAEGNIHSESDLKSEMDKRFQEIIAGLGEDDRKTIYLDYQSFEYLKAFCDMDLQTLLNHFTYDTVRGGFTSPFSEVTKRILYLAEMLKSLKLPPSKTGLKALFLFIREPVSVKTDELEEFLKREYHKAEQALVRIRDFNRHIPLALIVKGITGDYNYLVAGLKSGEDWYVLLKKYWVRRLNDLFQDYRRDLRAMTVVEKAFQIIGTKKFEEIKYYHPSYYDNKLPVTHWRSLSFILGFFKNIFVPRISKSLKILFLNGEFYKTENRIEYTDTYNFLNTLNEKLLLFEKLLTPAGEIGKAMDEIKKEKALPETILKKLEPLIKKADAEALHIVERTINALLTLNKILNGILYSEAGGKYDTLSNLGYIGGKENSALRKDWEKAITISYEVHQLLKELCAIEAPR